MDFIFILIYSKQIYLIWIIICLIFYKKNLIGVKLIKFNH